MYICYFAERGKKCCENEFVFNIKMTADIHYVNCTQIGPAVFHVLTSETHTHTHAQLQIVYLLYHPRFRHFAKNLFTVVSTNRYLLTRQILRCTRNYCAACNRTRRASILSEYNRGPPTVRIILPA